MVDEMSFPRGSSHSAKKIETEGSESNKLRPSQKRKASSGEMAANAATPSASSIDKDFLFGNRKKEGYEKSPSSSKRRKADDGGSTATNKHSLLPLGGGGVIISTKKHKHQGSSKTTVSTSTHIEALGFSKMAKGTKVLACVREVQEHYAIVSLPNLLTAYILPQGKPGQTPKYPLANILQVGQTLAVVVTKIAVEAVKGGQSRRRIQVSALPQDVNPRLLLAGEIGDNKVSNLTSTANRLARASVPIRGQIMSIEDHGCVIELGFGKRGFVSFDQVSSGGKNKDYNYVILEEDEDYEDEEDDDPSKRPIVLQKGRIYDFMVLPITTTSDQDQSATTVFPLSLPTTQRMAKQTVSSLTSTGGKGGNKRTATIPFSFSSLTPGWLIQVKVEAIANNGLCVSLFGNVFRGAMEMNHLGATLIPDCKDGAAAGGPDGGFQKIAASLFQNHQHFTARILAVDVPTKLIRLSMAPHILTLAQPSEPKNPIKYFPSAGTILSDCTVVKLDPGIGALLALPPQYNVEATSLMPKSLTKSCDLFQNDSFQEASHIRKVYVHISKALDDSEEADADNDGAITGRFNKEFAPFSKHDVRILSTGHWLEGIAVGGCAPSILKAHVLTHADLVPGKVYKQVPICNHLPGGSVLVQLGGGRIGTGKGKRNKSSSAVHRISGLIPPAQLFDVVSKNSSEYRQRIFKTKYALDAKVDVRVLWVDPLRKKCLVTAKKTIVQADQEEIITEYSNTKVGQLAVGFVSRVDDQGLSITFCNKVYGKVTARSLAADLGVEDHRETYSVGDVVTTRIVQVKRVSGKGSFAEDEQDYGDDDEMEGVDDAQTKSLCRRERWELILSLKVHEGEDEDDTMKEDEVDIHNPQQVRLRAGAILPGKSMKIVELVDGKTKQSGGYVPGYALVSIKSKHLVDEESLGKAKMLSNVECKLPYSNLVDSFDPIDILNVQNLNTLAKRVLTVGKKIKQKGLVLVDPHKSNVDYVSGIGAMPVVSLRKNLIDTIESQSNAKELQPDKLPIVPSPDTSLFVGAYLLGFVAQVDTRHGAFIRFLDGMTGMVPKKNGGLQLRLYDTMVTKITVIDDSVLPHRILLEPVSGPGDSATINTKQQKNVPLKAGDKISKAKLLKLSFHEASLTTGPNEERLFMHCAEKDSKLSVIKARKKPLPKQSPGTKPLIAKNHPFYDLKIGQELKDLTVLSVQTIGNQVKIWVTDKEIDEENPKKDAPLFLEKASDLNPGMKMNGVIVAYAKDNSGIFVQVGPKVQGFVSGLELSRDIKVLNDLESNVPLGALIECRVVKVQVKGGSNDPFLLLSVLTCDSKSTQIPKPGAGDLVIGRINKGIKPVLAPSLMVNLRGGVGRCCITELDEPDEWVNMPLGQSKKEPSMKNGNDDAMNGKDDESETAQQGAKDDNTFLNEDTFLNKEYVECRVLGRNLNGKHFDVSMRPSRISGDLDDDPAPASGDIVQGYVLQTTTKGCFIRFSRTVEGRSTLRELCDGYIANPSASFPMGRLVVGKIKETRPVSKKGRHSNDPVTIQADVDMRESILVEEKDKLLSYEDINVGEKHKGTVQTVTKYGVFVRIERSNMDGLVHLSECSDKFIKDLETLYSPGDLVKVLVVRKDDDAKRLAYSMKASHFEDDDDTDDSSVDSDIEMEDSDDESVETEKNRELQDSDDGLDSDDENFTAKLAAQMNDDDSGDESEDDSVSKDDGADSDDDGSSSSEDEGDDAKNEEDLLDTNVGFSWDAGALGNRSGGFQTKDNQNDSSDDSDSDSDSDSDDDGNEKSKSRKSRKRQAKKRLEEQETSRRETALADGTADSNPETAADFERLLSGEPNNSELWIRYMAFHLSLADIPSARKVAEEALQRIEFREEKEKLNVWSALLTLEHKFGNDDTFQGAIDQACKQNNPKQVYLRACEIRANDVEQSSNDPASVQRADALFATMCKKHKSKKTVWLAHMQYLLKQSRDRDAHALMKRAMLSLSTHKHAEMMSKFAQMEFELGTPERGRTIFDGLLLKYNKRLDLFFVYLDKECKFGNVEHARSMLEKKVEERKLSDRDRKSVV